MRKFLNFSIFNLFDLESTVQEKLSDICHNSAETQQNKKFLHYSALFLCLLNGLSLSLMPLTIGRLIKEIALLQVSGPTFKYWSFAFLALIVIYSLSTISLELLLYNFTIDSICNLRQNIFKLINYSKYAQIQRLPTGNLSNYLLVELDYIAHGIEMFYKQFCTAACSLIFSFIIMWNLNLYLMLIIVILSPLTFLVTNYISHKTFHYFTVAQNEQAQQSAMITETVNNIMRIKQQNNRNYAESTFSDLNEKLQFSWQQAIFYSSLSNPLNRILNNLIYILVAFFGLVFLQINTVDLGSLTAFLAYTNEFSQPFSDLNGVITELSQADGAYQDLKKFLLGLSGENRSLQASEPVPTQGLNVQNVNFSYVEQHPILKAINFSLASGKTLAIVGPSGSGKSTIINLLMQFYQPDSGKISLNDQTAATVALTDWRNNFAMVLQDSWIFQGSIRENLLFANSAASDAELWAACERAEIAEFISRLPKQFDTVIGTELMLSYSQQQLLALARLFLKPAKIILLDEASSAVDCFSEIKIQKAIKELSKDKSMLVVAHRLVSIMHADRIILLENGKIQESGSHNELIAAGGKYYKLWQSQYPLAHNA